MARKGNAQFWYYDAVNDSFDVGPFEGTSTSAASEIIARSELPLTAGNYVQTPLNSKEMVVSKIIDATP